MSPKYRKEDVGASEGRALWARGSVTNARAADLVPGPFVARITVFRFFSKSCKGAASLCDWHGMSLHINDVPVEDIGLRKGQILRNVALHNAICMNK